MDVKARYQEMLRPSNDLLADIGSLRGDIMILGVGGKMGPGLARLAREAVTTAGLSKDIIGVARFSEPGLQQELESQGIKTIAADLLDDNQLQQLPEPENILYLAGTKFGTTGKESFTWAMNSYLPGRVAEKFKRSRIVVFSTGNVYPLMPVSSGGATEQQLPEPIGEYAQSCLGRERIFQHFSSKNNTPTLIYRLNYANDVTYGVLLDIAKAVKDRKPVDLRMGYVNVIWQGEANELALRCLSHCSTPSTILNVTGPDTASVRQIAIAFGELFNTDPVFCNEEQQTALLSNASECYQRFGTQKVSINQMIEMIAQWIHAGGKVLNKPTHFQEREGKF
jgi:nucleoside-diphosphate-sugar epimerase